MSPTVFRERGYRFFFFSREEKRMHIHVHSEDGEVKFWLEPKVELARNYRLSKHQLNEIESILEEHYDELKTHGKTILNTEVTNISSHGFWLICSEIEYFLSYTDFPWFKDASVGRILNVEEPIEYHFYWPDLDVDLSLDIIKNPEKFPLESQI